MSNASVFFRVEELELHEPAADEPIIMSNDPIILGRTVRKKLLRYPCPSFFSFLR